MQGFGTLLRASVTMLRRNRMLLVTSLGLALISIFVFGWLFGGSGSVKLTLGVVDQDGSAAATQLVSGLQRSGSLTVKTGTQDEELRALRDGDRNAVIVLPPGFGEGLTAGRASIAVYYDQSNPVTQSATQMAVQSIVAGLNQQLAGRPPAVTLDQRAVSVHHLGEVDWLTPGMLGMLLMWANLGVGATLVLWRQQGVLKRLAVTPLRPSALVGSQMLARLLLSLAQGALLLGVAMLVFHVQVTGSWLALAATVTLGALVMMSLGFVGGSFARTPETAQTVTFLVSFPMMFLSGSYFPVDSAPRFLDPLIRALPLTYLNDALRQVMNNGAGISGIQADLLVLVAWLLAGALLSVRAFRWA